MNSSDKIDLLYNFLGTVPKQSIELTSMNDENTFFCNENKMYYRIVDEEQVKDFFRNKFAERFCENRINIDFIKNNLKIPQLNSSELGVLEDISKQIGFSGNDEMSPFFIFWKIIFHKDLSELAIDYLDYLKDKNNEIALFIDENHTEQNYIGTHGIWIFSFMI